MSSPALVQGAANMDASHDWYDGPPRFEDDALIRGFGWTLEARPEHGEAIWVWRCPGIFRRRKHSEVLNEIKRKMKDYEGMP